MHAYSQKTIYIWIALTKLDKQDEPNESPGPKLDDLLISRITQIPNDDPFASTRQITEKLKITQQSDNILLEPLEEFTNILDGCHTI